MAARLQGYVQWPPGALVLLVALTALAPPTVNAVNILAILNTPTRSHHIWNSPLMTALAARGHNLTVLSPIPHSPPVPNITDLILDGAMDLVTSESSEWNNYENMVTWTAFDWVRSIFEWYLGACNQALSTNGVQQLNNYPDDFRFDLIIIEATGGECLLGFVEKFGRPPVVAVNGFSNPQWVNWIMGNPDNPAYVSNAQLTLRWPFSFLDKLKNVGMYAATLYYYYWDYLPAMDELIKGFFKGPTQPPPVEQILRNVSLLLVNAHYSLDGARPDVPNVVPIAGIHVKEPKPLPKDLQQWLDGATGGAIFFSLGSIVRADRLNGEQISSFVEAFGELPSGVRVLWKWNGDSPPPGLPPNVRVAKWMPQSDILAHPNVRVFITHAGLLSTHEATWRGVPLVALPFIVDQFLNTHRLVTLGVAERLEYYSLSKERVLGALTKVLGDNGYRERMRELSALFRARPQAPLDTAIYWIEHVLRHVGAPRMRSPTAELPWYQPWLLDVAAVAALASLAAIVAVLLPVAYLVGGVNRLKGRSKTKAE